MHSVYSDLLFRHEIRHELRDKTRSLRDTQQATVESCTAFGDDKTEATTEITIQKRQQSGRAAGPISLSQTRQRVEREETFGAG